MGPGRCGGPSSVTSKTPSRRISSRGSFPAAVTWRCSWRGIGSPSGKPRSSISRPEGTPLPLDKRPGRRTVRLAARCALLAAGLAVSTESAVLAQTPPKIVRVLVEGNQRISDEAVIHLMTVKEGDPYDEALLKEEFKRIWARGLFKDLSIETRDMEGGVAVIVHVLEKEIVNSLKYEESKVVGETQIEDALKNRNC